MERSKPTSNWRSSLTVVQHGEFTERFAGSDDAENPVPLRYFQLALCTVT